MRRPRSEDTSVGREGAFHDGSEEVDLGFNGLTASTFFKRTDHSSSEGRIEQGKQYAAVKAVRWTPMRPPGRHLELYVAIADLEYFNAQELAETHVLLHLKGV